MRITVLAQGVPARVVMDVLGQSKMAITTYLYSHVMPTALREAANAIDRAVAQVKSAGKAIPREDWTSDERCDAPPALSEVVVTKAGFSRRPCRLGAAAWCPSLAARQRVLEDVVVTPPFDELAALDPVQADTGHRLLFTRRFDVTDMLM